MILGSIQIDKTQPKNSLFYECIGHWHWHGAYEANKNAKNTQKCVK
jgi:hypothetical protein